MHPGCLDVRSLAVWAHIDSANTQRTHSSIQHTADLWSICDSSLTICSFFWPSLSRHTFCRNLSTLNEDKGEHQSPIYQSTLNYLSVPCTDGWITSTGRCFFSPPADVFYLPPPDVFLRLLRALMISLCFTVRTRGLRGESVFLTAASFTIHTDNNCKNKRAVSFIRYLRRPFRSKVSGTPKPTTRKGWKHSWSLS